MAFRHLETTLHRIHQSRFLRCPERLWVLRPIRLLKISPSRLRPNRFFECPECRKCFRIPYRHHETSLHWYHQRRILRRSKGKLWVLRIIRLLETSLKRLHPSRFFRCWGCRKWVHMDFGHLETSLHRLHQSRFLRYSEGRLWVLWAIRLLKTFIKRLRPNIFYACPENALEWLFDIMKHRSSTSPSSLFNTVRRQTMSSKVHSPT
jgi:hypothetical protein